jgi:stage III sporulation protein AB
MAKFLVGLAIVAFTSFCGFAFAKKYRVRKQFFTQFYEFNNRFLSEVNYFKRPIAEVCKRFTYRGEFDLLLNGFLKKREEYGEKLGAVRALDLQEFHFLTADEQAFIGDYFLTIGRSDTLSQKAYFGAAKEKLAEWKKNCEESCKKYGDLYLKLGFLCGLAVLILIV